MPDYANGTRSFVEGLTFNNAAELEAALRAAAAQRNLSLDDFLKLYRSNKQGIDESYNRWAEANPGPRLAGEGIGALLPGVIAAFVPGGQGATVAAAGRSAPLVARVGKAMAEPLTMLAERVAPSIISKRGVPLALALGDETLTGALQSVGAADTLAAAPEQIASDLPKNLAFSLGIRSANVAAKPALRVGAAAARPVTRFVRERAPSFSVPMTSRGPQLSVKDRLINYMYGAR